MKIPHLAASGTAFLAILAAGPARADDVYLTNGGVISGIVRSESDWITVEIPGGTVSLPSSQVSRVEKSRHVLQEYYERLAALEKSKDAQSTFNLAAWCKEKGLTRPSVELSQRVIAIEPDHGGARAILGHQKRDGRWLSPEEARRADGQVEFRGRWIAQPERDRILREEDEARRDALARSDERRRQEEERRREAASRPGQQRETLVLGIGSVGEPYHRYYRPRSGRGRGGHVRGIRGVTRPGSTIRR